MPDHNEHIAHQSEDARAAGHATEESVDSAKQSLVPPILQLSSSQVIQRGRGDGHDLTSPRFASNDTLQEVYDGNEVVENGDRGDHVRLIQHAVWDAGVRFRIYGIDGIFEDETERAVRLYQDRNGIRGDTRGKVGSNTIESLDQRYQVTALPADADQPWTMSCMLQILCAWNEPMINDIRDNLRLIVCDRLFWADEQYDGSGWIDHPMEGAGETENTTIRIATNDTCQAVARTLYHEYQHARAPYTSRRNWAGEESRAYTLETNWAIARGLAADPGLTTTDPDTGETVVDEAAVEAHVETYPGLDSTNPGEVIGKVGANRVRVRLDDGSVIVRNAVAGDTVAGPRRVTNPRVVRNSELTC